jgi:mannose-6-phosphate isomerase-like protein (cupin superfamily)
MSSISKIFDPIFAGTNSLSWRDAFPGEEVAIIVDNLEVGGASESARPIIGPMVGPPMHVHHDADEVLYVLEGTADFECDGSDFGRAEAGWS